uniref:Uncharacterized protein n=1 Tax=Macrostomum lignano TaxID=282301 RepID=A0A1I8FL36_9PLAT
MARLETTPLRRTTRRPTSPALWPNSPENCVAANRSCGPSWPRAGGAVSRAEPDRSGRLAESRFCCWTACSTWGPLAEARSGLAASRFVHHLQAVRRGLRQLQALDDGGIGVKLDFVGCCAPTIWSQWRGLLGRHLRRQRLVAEASQPPSKQTAEPPRGGTNLTTGCPGPGSG